MDLYYIEFLDGSTLVEYGDSVEDIQQFLNRSYYHKGTPTIVEIYDETRHSIEG